MFQHNIPDFWTIFKFKRNKIVRRGDRDREKWIKLNRFSTMIFIVIFIICIFLTKLKVENGILKILK